MELGNGFIKIFYRKWEGVKLGRVGNIKQLKRLKEAETFGECIPS
jgi:hypothetical protein